MATIERALADEGPLTRAQLRERLEAAGVPHRGPGASSTCSSSPRCGGSSCAGRWSASSTPTSSSATGSARSRPVDRDVGAGRARPPLPRRPRPGRRARPREVGRPAAARRPRRPGGDRLRAGGARGRAARLGRAPAGRRAAPAAPARRLRPGPARLDLPRGDPRPRTRELVTSNGLFRPFAMVEGRAAADLEAREGEGDDRAARAGSRSEDRAALEADATDVERFLAEA